MGLSCKLFKPIQHHLGSRQLPVVHGGANGGREVPPRHQAHGSPIAADDLGVAG